MLLPKARNLDLTFGIDVVIPTFGYIIKNDFANTETLKSQAYTTDLVISFLGGIGVIVTGKPNYLAKSLLQEARMTDRFVGRYNGTIIQGSLKTLIG